MLSFLLSSYSIIFITERPLFRFHFIPNFTNPDHNHVLIQYYFTSSLYLIYYHYHHFFGTNYSHHAIFLNYQNSQSLAILLGGSIPFWFLYTNFIFVFHQRLTVYYPITTPLGLFFHILNLFLFQIIKFPFFFFFPKPQIVQIPHKLSKFLKTRPNKPKQG